MKINQSLLNRLAAKNVGKYRSPFKARPVWEGIQSRLGAYHTRWAGTPGDWSELTGASHSIISSIRHTGWYCDTEGHVLIFGIVREVRTTRGTRYLACTNDPWNGDKDGDGPCAVEVKEDGSFLWYDCEREAARHADAIAERYAEVERENDEAYQEQMAQEQMAE